MTIYKVINMFLKEERKREKSKFTKTEKIANIFMNVRIINEIDNRKSCKTCDKMYKSICYIEYLNLISK